MNLGTASASERSRPFKCKEKERLHYVLLISSVSCRAWWHGQTRCSHAFILSHSFLCCCQVLFIPEMTVNLLVSRYTCWSPGFLSRSWSVCVASGSISWNVDEDMWRVSINTACAFGPYILLYPTKNHYLFKPILSVNSLTPHDDSITYSVTCVDCPKYHAKSTSAVKSRSVMERWGVRGWGGCVEVAACTLDMTNGVVPTLPLPRCWPLMVKSNLLNTLVFKLKGNKSPSHSRAARRRSVIGNLQMYYLAACPKSKNRYCVKT